VPESRVYAEAGDVPSGRHPEHPRLKLGRKLPAKAGTPTAGSTTGTLVMFAKRGLWGNGQG